MRFGVGNFEAVVGVKIIVEKICLIVNNLPTL